MSPQKYTAFGLVITANRPVPGLLPAADQAVADVVLHCQPSAIVWQSHLNQPQQTEYVSPHRLPDGKPPLIVTRFASGGYHFVYADQTEFIVDSDGTEIWTIWPPDEATVADMATYLLGPVLGFLLRLRGVVCLHASVVASPAGAVAFVGPPQAGKSTTAALLAQAGYPVLSDDVAPLWLVNDVVMVQPTHPRLRLWEDSAQVLFGGELPQLSPNYEKQFFDLAAQAQFFTEPLPLVAIYLLQPRMAQSSEPVVAGVEIPAGLMTLITHSYTNYLLDKQMRADEFELLSYVAATIPMRQLTAVADATRLDELGQVIEADWAQLLVGARG